MEPKIYVDSENDFITIKIKNGIEAKSYEKDGFIFCEDSDGNIIEIQVLNINDLSKLKQTA